MTARRRMPRPRRGFTVVELTVAGVLMVVVSLILARAWATFGRSALLAVARARIAQEANLAVEAIARDAGRLARVEPGAGGDDPQASVRPRGSAVVLRLDDGTGPVQEVTYEIDPDDPGKLFRSDAAGRRVVAGLVADFRAEPASRPSAAGDRVVPGVDIALTLSHRVLDRDPDGTPRPDLTRRYLLFVEAEAP